MPIGSAVVHAEIKEYVGVGESIVGDRETLEPDTDKVVAFTAGVVKVGNVSYEPVQVEHWLKYRATVVVTLDTDDLTNQINAWLGINAQDRSTITEQTKALNGTLDMIQSRTVELETAVAGATATVDSAKVQEDLKQIDRDILYAQKISESNRALKAGDRAGAMKLYQEAIALYPKDATIAYEKLGDGYRDAKNYIDAIDAYTKVIQLDSRYSVPYFKRGQIYFKRKDYRKAAADFEKVIELAPTSAQAYNPCGWAYFYLKDYDAVERIFHEVWPRHVGISVTLVDFVHRRKREPEIADLTKAVELNPNDVSAYNNRGLLYHKNNQFKLAIQDYEKALRLVKGWRERSRYYQCIGECYEKVGYTNAP